MFAKIILFLFLLSTQLYADAKHALTKLDLHEQNLNLTLQNVDATKPLVNLNQRTKWSIVFKSSEPGVNITSLSFDASMPSHRHGTVLKPKITRVSNNEFSIEGVQLHMRGEWLLVFKVETSNAKKIKFSQMIILDHETVRIKS